VNKTFIALITLAAGAAQAHVTLEQPRAAAESAYKAVLRVGHGCEGTATHTLTVRLPAGFRGAKPMPKPGWTLSITRAALAQPYESHGRKVTDDVVEISWKATSREAWLADAHYDEFVLRGQVPAAPGQATFKVQQLCEKGQWDWDAPLDVQPKAAAGHAH
jgi:periplasmic copper chaperone A